MKILYLLTNCEGLGVARKLAEEGNFVQVFLQDDTIESDPSLVFVDSWREHLTDIDLVIGGSMGFERYEEVFKKFGKPYLGGSKLGSLLIKDKLGEFLEICTVPKSEQVLPDYGLTGFFNGRDWVEPCFRCVIDEHFMDEELGPVVGPMGVVLKKDNKYRQLLNELKVGFSRMGIRDMITIFMAGDGVVGIGCGISYDILECIIEGSKDRITDLLFELATGTAKNLDFTEDFVISVRVSIPPFPYASDTNGHCEVLGIHKDNLRHLFLDEVQIQDDDYFGCTATGRLLKATARGRDIREAKRRVYRTLNNLEIPNKQYRTDIGTKAQRIL